MGTVESHEEDNTPLALRDKVDSYKEEEDTDKKSQVNPELRKQFDFPDGMWEKLLKR